MDRGRNPKLSSDFGGRVLKIEIPKDDDVRRLKDTLDQHNLGQSIAEWIEQHLDRFIRLISLRPSKHMICGLNLKRNICGIFKQRIRGGKVHGW